MTLGEIGQLLTGIAALYAAIMGVRNSKKLDEVHKSTNGLAERNEAIAKKLGIAEGTAAGLKEGREESK
jgi:hypothetical protein